MVPVTNSTSGGRSLRVNWTMVLGDVGAEWGCSWGTSTVAPTRRRHATPYFMAWWQQLAWTAIFALMVFVAVGGNSIVMWIVLAHRRMRTVTNYFLVNLSVADLLMAIFNCIFNFVYMLNSDWQFGRPYCTVNNFVANLTVAASVFTLTGISIDRYLAIVKPLKPRMSKLSARITIAIIWFASATIGFPCILYSEIITYKSSGGQVRTACILVWPDGQPMISTLDYIYNVFLFIVTYVIPMSAMAGCYSAMGKELWGSRSIGELTQRQIDSIQSKRKVVRMFIIIVLIFAICWLPYHAYFIYTHHHSSVAYTKYVQHLYLAFYWLAMANCMVNPLIYYWMNARFRQYFKHAVCKWNFTRRRKQSQMDGAETPPMLGRYNSHSYSRSRSADEYSGNRLAAGRVQNGSNGSNGSRRCACGEHDAASTRHAQVSTSRNPPRVISDLSENRGAQHEQHFYCRCRHYNNEATTTAKHLSAVKINGGTICNFPAKNSVTRKPNHIQWRKNKYLFEFNESGSNKYFSSSLKDVPDVNSVQKQTMDTSVDV